MKKKNILVFGYFGYETGQLDGQTIKTRTIYDLLKGRLPEQDYTLGFFDTEVLKKGKWRLLALFPKLFRCDKVVYMPAQNNLLGFFSILYRLSHIFGFDILYVMIGGWLPSLLEKHPELVAKLAGIKAIFPENKNVVARLETDYGIKNTILLPNFRNCDFCPEISSGNFTDRPFRLVFMSRISVEKGIETVFRVVQRMNERRPGKVTVDFFGQIEPASAAVFEKCLAGTKSVHYRGALQPEEIIPVLAGYDMLVLPTFYPGEGFPGAIVEAYLAGLPVAVSDWKYNAEYVYEEKTGFVIPIDEKQTDRYVACVENLMDNPEKLSGMKQAAFEEGRRYTADAAWSIINAYIQR